MDLTLITRETKRAFNIDFLNEAKAKEIYDYHSSFDAYEKTPLVDLEHLAKHWGVKNIFVKDESYRFGLNAFKVLGGSYALGKVIAEKLGVELSELPYKRLISDEIREKLGEVTFVTATDGNHGRGVAWTARELKQKAIVFMPKGTVQERVDHITKLGAKVEVTEMNYDDTVRYANDLAEKNGYIMVQDTAWEGYEEIPEWIMQGYMTLAYEITAELNEKNVRPTHVFLQAGVGSFAAAATGYFSNVYRDNKPQIAIVEPDAVACIYESAKEDRRVLIGGGIFHHHGRSLVRRAEHHGPQDFHGLCGALHCGFGRICRTRYETARRSDEGRQTGHLRRERSVHDWRGFEDYDG